MKKKAGYFVSRLQIHDGYKEFSTTLRSLKGDDAEADSWLEGCALHIEKLYADFKDSVDHIEELEASRH